MKQPDFQAFEANARAQGFDEVLERQWAPATVLETHAHPFAVRALVVQGEMWLTVGDAIRHLHPGDEFTLEVACRTPSATAMRVPLIGLRAVMPEPAGIYWRAMMFRLASCPMIRSTKAGASRPMEPGLKVVVVAAHTNCLVRTSNNLVSTVARSYWRTC